MKIVQEAVAFNSGINFLPNKMILRLPERKTDTGIFLLSDSFEYDIEMIRNMPHPKTDYRNIIIPSKINIKFGPKTFTYGMSQQEYVKRVKYVNDQKLTPGLTPVKFPYPRTMKDNVYITMSDLIKGSQNVFRTLPISYIEENIQKLFEQLIHPLKVASTNVMFIDTTKFKIYSDPTPDTYKTDIINALLAAFVLQPSRMRRIPFTFVFRGSGDDYKFDLNMFDERDVDRMQSMLSAIGKPLPNDMVGIAEREGDPITNAENDVEDMMNVPENPDDEDGEDSNNPKTSTTIQTDINASIQSIKAKYASTVDTTDPLERQQQDASRKLRQAKELAINAQLLKRISVNTGMLGNYETIAADMTDASNSPVEDKLINQAAKTISGVAIASNTQNAMDTVTSQREQKMRQRIGQLKLGDVTFDTLTSVTDVPKPLALNQIHMSTINPGAKQGTSFTNISKAYEDNLMDRDIVSTFMNLSKLPDGFEVTNVEVTDVSTVQSLTNNWRVSLRSKLTGRLNTINIRVPRVINGRFYNNGIWYNIGKQDFPLPILKLNPKRVMLTGNYGKITVERYDTRSLVDLGILVKVMTKFFDDQGNHKYIKPGNSTATNARFTSTVEYDEFAKNWYSFINKEAKMEIYFNRTQCLKLYGFVTVEDNEFCCGMINQVPIIVNTDTGLTNGEQTLTDLIISHLPPELVKEYQKVKPGKRAMYSEMNAGGHSPVGLTCCAWEGLTNVLKKANIDYKIAQPRTSQTGYFSIPFKDQILLIKNTIQNQLFMNGFLMINTRAYNIADFETPIMNPNSVYIDIYNQHFFKQYSQLTTFIACYNFFVDAITYDVCNHYNLPNDVVSMLIYASNLLADNNYANENNSAYYRIRSSEVIPAIIHSEIAFAISKYKNATGSKARDHLLKFNANCVIMELEKLGTTSTASALNPMVELHEKENITQKGFHGVNKDRAYNLVKRSYDDTMIGKVAMATPNNANVGINRQLVADPKIESVRGYTSTTGVDGNYNDLQLASFSELLTPGTVSHDDAIRTAIATSQTSHIVATADSSPVLISNGADEVAPSCLTDEFSVVAEDNGIVLEINQGYMIVQYKNGKKRAIPVDNRYSSNPASGFYVNNKLQTNFQAKESFKKGDILAYHERFFTKGNDGVVRMNIGPIAKVAFMGLYSTFEDAGMMTESFSKKLATNITMMQDAKIDATDNIEKIVQVGDEVEIGDPLVVFGLGDTGDKSVDNFIKSFQSKSSSTILDSAKRVIKSKHAGRVVDVRMYTCKSLDKLSPSLYEIFNRYFEENRKKRKILDKYDKTDSVYKLDTLYSLPTEPLKGNQIKGRVLDVLIEVYIEHEDFQSVGDKLVAFGASKQVISEVIPIGQEPYAESNPDEEISVVVSSGSVLKRMIPTVMITAAGNKVLIELKRRCRELWESS